MPQPEAILLERVQELEALLSSEKQSMVRADSLRDGSHIGAIGNLNEAYARAYQEFITDAPFSAMRSDAEREHWLLRRCGASTKEYMTGLFADAKKGRSVKMIEHAQAQLLKKALERNQDYHEEIQKLQAEISALRGQAA